MSITLRDIARETGFSATTVSLALRKHPKISAGTQETVQRVANEMGYRLNPYISILMAQKRAARPVHYQATLGFLTAWPKENSWEKVTFCSKVYKGALVRAKELGYMLEPFWITDPSIPVARWNQILQARNIGGLILAPLPATGPFPELDWEKFTLATVGNTVTIPKISRVTPHQYHGMTTALRHVNERGYKRVGVILHKWVDDKVDETWSAAYLAWRERQPKSCQIPVFWADEDENLIPRLKSWLKRWRPEVVVGYTVGSELLQTSGFQIPLDIAFVHLDNESATPKNGTGVNQQAGNIGAAAVDLVVAQIHRSERGIPTLPKTIMIEAEWDEGNTLPNLK